MNSDESFFDEISTSFYSESDKLKKLIADLLKNQDPVSIDKIIQRKIKNDIKVAVLLNEKEGGVMFSTIKGNPDISKMFYGNSELFHEWCLDYFRYCWHNSSTFQEEKLKKKPKINRKPN